MILNIYKEKGWTSFDVVAKCRGILKTKKVGHAGTLDPLAEGVLLVLTDKDTKQQDSLMHTQKEYIADVTFGIDSPTFDLGYQAIKIQNITNFPEFDLSKYIVEISQEVPIYSAVKVSGKKLYDYARSSSLDVVLPIKQITIYSIDILEKYLKEVVINEVQYHLPTMTIKVACSSGTYIRALARDFGKDAGVPASLTRLVRTRVGDFTIDESIRLSDLQN